MRMEVLGFVFAIICLIPAYLFRKKISYLFCPDDVIGYWTKYNYFGLYNFLPSFLIVGFTTTQIREWMQINEILKSFENFSLLIGFILLLISLFVTGLITDKVLATTNQDFKGWKERKTTTNKM